MIALEFGSASTPRVDLLKRDGSIVTVAGGGPSPIQEGIPANQAALAAIRATAVAPDGAVFIAPGDGTSRLLRIGPALPGFDGTETVIANATGSELYVFDADGKHLRTLNALTGAALFEFGYDADGRLTQVTEKTGGTDNVTTIRRAQCRARRPPSSGRSGRSRASRWTVTVSSTRSSIPRERSFS